MHTCKQILEHTCGLCGGREATLVHQHPYRPIVGRRFLQCRHCGLIQAPFTDRLSPAAEKAEYDLHQNASTDPGYRRFLQRLMVPLHKLLGPMNPAAGTQSFSGLDFGSGPGPVLSTMLRELGYQCTDYDLFYAYHPQRLQQQYDFITATEVFEHLATPAEVMTMLIQCLRPQGLLAVMMQRPDEQPTFAQWGYIKDPTHISFYTNQALEFMSEHWSLTEIYRDRDVIIWRRR